MAGNFECFQYFNFEINFPKNENLFQQAEVPFLFESTKIENTTSNFYNAFVRDIFCRHFTQHYHVSVNTKIADFVIPLYFTQFLAY